MESNALGRIILTVLSAISWSYYFLPVRARRGAGIALGRVMRAASLRSKVVMENLMIAYPPSAQVEAPARERGTEATALPVRRERLYDAAYDHLGHLAFEILMLLGPMRKYVDRYAELRGIENWREAKKQGKGVIFLSSHVGNWEIMAATGAMRGIDLMMVTKHLKPEWLHQAIEAGRAKCGVRATYEPRTFRDVLGHLKRNGTVGFVLDQYAGAPVGIRVPVFGTPVGTSTVIATLAKRTGAPVVPVVNYRLPDGRLIVEIQSPLQWKSEGEFSSNDLAVNTAHYASVLEKHILAHPHQWLWIHRRFKGDLSPLRPGEWDDGRARQ